MNDEKILLLSRQCAQLAGHVAYLETFLPIFARYVKLPPSVLPESQAILADRMGSLFAEMTPDLQPEFRAGFQAAATAFLEIGAKLTPHRF